jgi:chromosome segregation ATPase
MFMSKQDVYRQKVEAEIEEQKARLELLKAQAKQQVADGKLGVYEEIEKLESKLTEAKSTLLNLKDSGEEALEKLGKSIKGLFSK